VQRRRRRGRGDGVGDAEVRRHIGLEAGDELTAGEPA
jgi:hypothetical protein